MQLKANKSGNLSSAFILFSGISTLGLFITRDQSTMLFMAFFAAFVGYFWLAYGQVEFRMSFTLGLVSRLVLFIGLPILSDDVYRFLWDGSALVSGINPYAFRAEDLFASSENPLLNKDLFDLLNSKDKYTVYPPLNQLLFWVSIKVSGSNLLLGTNILRVFILLADIGAFLLLRKLLIQRTQNVALANWYWLNPLVILEFTGNLHFEGIVIFFLIGGLYWIGSPLKSGIMFGLAAATKLLPLIFFPALFLRYKFSKGATIAGLGILIVILSIAPFLNQEFFAGMGNSLELYFNKFEFNASIYYFVRWVGFQRYGYNLIATIGPFLSVLSVLTILEIALHGRWRSWSLEVILLLTLTIYLALSTTVHPWYILPLIIFGLLSGYFYPVIWSFMAIVTYFGYTIDGYSLPMGWVILEYVVVIVFGLYELTKRYQIEAHHH